MDYSGFRGLDGKPRVSGWKAASVVMMACLLGCTEGPSAPAGPAASAAGNQEAPIAARTDGAPRPSAGCTHAPHAAVVEQVEELQVAGHRRQFILDAPPSTADDPRPLILAFHGFGDSAAGFRRGLRLHDLGERERVIVVHPHGRDDVHLMQHVGRGWDLAETGGPDQEFVEAILAAIESTRCVDRRRIFATGFSNGGLFSNLLACTLGDRFATVVAVGGAAALDDCTPSRPIPVLLLHGSADRVIDPLMVRRARNWWAQQNGCEIAITEGECVSFDDCAADVMHCEGPQAHRWPRDGVDRMWRFFAAHPLPASVD